MRGQRVFYYRDCCWWLSEIRWMCRRYPPEAKTNGRYQAILAQLGGRLHIIHGENFPHGYEKRCRKEGGWTWYLRHQWWRSRCLHYHWWSLSGLAPHSLSAVFWGKLGSRRHFDPELFGLRWGNVCLDSQPSSFQLASTRSGCCSDGLPVHRVWHYHHGQRQTPQGQTHCTKPGYPRRNGADIERYYDQEMSVRLHGVFDTR